MVMREQTAISERRACQLVGLSRTVLHFAPKVEPENEQLQSRLVELAGERRRFGYPKAIRTDQGPEFTGRALDQWACLHGVQLKLIQAGKPTQNAFIESFNGRFRDKCLNDHWFTTLPEARILISAWRRDYNQHGRIVRWATRRQPSLRQDTGRLIQMKRPGMSVCRIATQGLY